MFIERYPNNEATSEFPHSEDKSVFTMDSLVAKIKRVKLCFRKATDFSSKSNPINRAIGTKLIRSKVFTRIPDEFGTGQVHN